jgi:MoxR-like ATPase
VVAAKARAVLAGRLAPTLADVQALAAPVLRHRLIRSFEAEADEIAPDRIIADLVAAVPPPTSPLAATESLGQGLRS